MSIASEIQRINTNIANAYTSIENKGGTLPSTQNSANLVTAIDSITGGGGSVEPNIFVQTTEPETKKGIWLQKEATPEHYTYDDEVFIAGEWAEDGTITEIPANFSKGGVAKVGNDIYLFPGSRKYNILTNSYTSIASTPLGGEDRGVIAVGTDVYQFGGRTAPTTGYKYDTLTNTYTKTTNIPYSFYAGGITSIGTDIYLFGGRGNGMKAYKYNTSTNTYTQIALIPTDFYYGSVATIGNNIYLFGGESYKTYAYKYDISMNTYTRIKDIPYNFAYGSAISIGTDIYLFSSTVTYKYDTLNDNYTQLDNIPYNCNYCSGVLVGTKAYLFGGTSYPKKVQVYTLESKTYEQDNLVVISQGKYRKVGYDIELYSNSKDVTPPKYAFADAWYYTLQGGLDGTIPTYYGDGTSWVKIKN